VFIIFLYYLFILSVLLICSPLGTTANQACEHISEKQRRKTGETGLWLLQTKSATATDGGSGDADTGGGFVNIRDGKHKLIDGNQYTALYYTGPDMYLMWNGHDMRGQAKEQKHLFCNVSSCCRLWYSVIWLPYPKSPSTSNLSQL